MSSVARLNLRDRSGALLVTGGAGFIGGNFTLAAVGAGMKVVNVDALTYAGNLDTLASLNGNPLHAFVQGDIGDSRLVARLLAEHRPKAIINFAAESHVDRSIDGPAAFIHTNVVGTLNLLETARNYWSQLGGAERERFRFLHISTDEVYGALGPEGSIQRIEPLRSKLAIFGLKGGVGPPSSCLSSNVRVAGAYYQLLQQLWAISVPREAHSVDDPQGSRG